MAAGPQGVADWLLVLVAVVVVVLVAVYAVRMLISPREKDPEHIKRRVLRDEATASPARSAATASVDAVAGEAAANESHVIVWLDDASEPLLRYRPPVRFELDTSRLEDGQHRLRIEAYDSTGQRGVRTVPFVVRNGPGIAINGISDNDVLEGKIDVLVNSYGGAAEAHWEPSRAETPAPVPTWAWVLFIVVVAFGVFYGVRLWNPPPEFAATPTYGSLALGSMTLSDLASAAAPGAGASQASSGAAPASESAAGAAGAAGGDAALGASVYANNCAACHQASGKGLPGVFPPLAGNAVVLDKDPATHIEIVLHGLQGKAIDGTKYDSPMPAWAGQLDDAQIAAVINHERSSWGNHAPAVTAQDVAKLRAAKK
ncbi:MAG: cytochrome c [Burkholderiaceae bacterium]|nr:cytochrome c [Burkholderiaceae bacterium]